MVQRRQITFIFWFCLTLSSDLNVKEIVKYLQAKELTLHLIYSDAMRILLVKSFPQSEGGGGGDGFYSSYIILLNYSSSSYFNY